MTTKHKTTHTTGEAESASPPSTTASETKSTTSSTAKAAKTTASTPLVTATAAGHVQSSKVGLQAVYQAMISGLLTHYAPTDVFLTAQGTFTRDDLIAEIQSFVSACQATQASNQSWRTAIQTERALELNIRSLRKAVRGIVQARFGAAGAQILQFGFPLPKPRTSTSETKAIAAKKSLATRKERNTLGKVQKKDIKGNVSVALVVTPGGTTQDAGGATTAAVSTNAAQAAVQGTVALAGSAAPAPTGTPVMTGTVAAGAAPGSAPVAGH